MSFNSNVFDNTEVKTKYTIEQLREDVYQQMLNMLKNKKMCHLSCATGFGKSVIFMRYAKEFPNERILYITDRIAAVNRMQKHLEKHNSKSLAKSYAYFARVESIEKKIQAIKNFDIIIFDESHLMGAHNCEKIVELAKEKNIKLLGGSASPIRADDIDISVLYFEENIISYSIKQAQYDGFMVEPLIISTVFRGIRIKDLNDKLKNNPHANWARTKLTSIEIALSERSSLGQSIEIAVKEGGRGIWIVFHPNIEVLNYTAPFINGEFRKIDKQCKFFKISSHKEHLKVENFIEQHKNFSVVHAVNMMTTGWHFDDISGIVINSLTNSVIKNIQQLGRALVMDSKKRAVIVDLVGRYVLAQKSKEKFGKLEELINRDTHRGENREFEYYDIDSDIFETNIDDVLLAIEEWSNKDCTLMSVEEAIELIKNRSYRLCDASIATGVPEDILKSLVEESIK